MALTQEDLQAIGALIQKSEQRIKTETQQGFDRLEDLINVAASNAVVTERRFKQHF